jgi:hypothetical protein
VRTEMPALRFHGIFPIHMAQPSAQIINEKTV